MNENGIKMKVRNKCPSAQKECFQVQNYDVCEYAFYILMNFMDFCNFYILISRAITYVIMQRKLLGFGAIADGTPDAKNASVDGPLKCTFFRFY
jgi:hypothetical protein